MQSHSFRAMNTSIVLAAEGEQVDEAFTTAQACIEEGEKRFTRFSHDSELMQLNRSSGTLFNASAEMMAVMCAAVEYHLATKGLFNPAILPDLKALGYDQSFETILSCGVRQYSYDHLWVDALPFSEINLDLSRNQILLPRGMQIDLGGIAKGWIAEQAARQMSRYVPTCGVNAGGDMFLIGQPDGHTHWEIGLEDPFDTSKDLMTLWVEDGAVATSSTTKRLWTQGQLQRHHLIDPRSGQPAQSPWVSVTVFAPNAAQAETFAKAILIAGTQNAQALLDSAPDISFLAVDVEKQLWKTPTEKEKIHDYL